MIAAIAASVGIGCWHRRARQTNLQHSHSELLPLFTFSRRQCNTTNSNSQRWVWYLLYWETYTGSIIVELPVPFWSRYRSVLIIVQSSLVSLLSVGWRSRSGYYIYGDRTFAASAPRLWNSLPRELKIATSLISFKRLLKTHLFRIGYEQ